MTRPITEPEGAKRAATAGTGAVATGGASRAGAVGGTGAGGAAGVVAGDPGAEGTSAVSAVSGGAARPQPYYVPLLQQLQPASPLLGPSPYSEPTRGLTERREPESHPVSPESRPASPESRSASPVRTARAGRRVSRPRPPPVPGTHSMTLRPFTAPQRVSLSSPPASSLPDGPDPKSDSLRAASPTAMRFLATAVTDPLFESTAASALVAELVDFAAACRLDYATSLVVESASASVCPPSVGGECALGTDVLEDRQEDLECFAAAVPHLVSMPLALEGDPDAPDIPTPRSYAEAIEGPYSSQWRAAMDAEMASWKSTGTYVDGVPLPGANIVSGMWIFRVKQPPGSPLVFKVRYVARGFSQRQGVDFFQTFSPTPKMTTLRVLLHVATQRDYELHSLDFSTAFLKGSLHKEIWLPRPPGFTGSFPAGTQWSLRRPVYGLRQAPREWHDTLRTTLSALGFAPSTADPSLFLRTDTTLPPFYVLVYVDDLVFATADTEALAHVKSELQKRHTCTDMGELISYLGLRITRDRAQRTITLTQSHMVQQVLQRFGFTYSSPQSTPLPTGHSLSAPPSDESVEPSGPYPELVACLMYLMTCTRPDLAYSLSLVARYVAPGRHRKVHWDVAKRVLCYLCSTSGMGLVLGGRARVVLTGHADASWVDDLATQRSSQGYTFSLGFGSVSWRSTRSSSVQSSSCEAEIYAGAMAAQELRWLTYLLTDLGEAPRSPPVLYVDNKAMLALCQEHRLEHRTKHITLRYFIARELQQRGQLRLAYVASRANTADVFTKALQPCDHQPCFAFLDWSCNLLFSPTLPMGSEGLGIESQCVHFGHPSAGGCQRSTGDPRLILEKGYWLVVLGGYGRTDPLLNKSFYPNACCLALQACTLPCPAPRCAALPCTPARCPAPLASCCPAQRTVSALLPNVPCTPSCPTCSHCLHAPALPHAYRQLPLSPAHAPTGATATAPTTTATAPTQNPSVQESLLPQLCEWAIWWGSPGGGASRARQRKPLSPQQRREWAVRWGATTGGTCESTHAGSAASRHGGSGGGQHQQQCPLETLSPQQLREWAVRWGSLGGGGFRACFAFLAVLITPHFGYGDSGASRCSFRESTTVTPLTAPVPVTLADPSGGPVVVRGATVLPCPVAPSGLLTGLHLPSFAKNLVATSVLQDQWVTVTQPGGKLVAIYMDSRTGEHLATFIRRLGSGQYTMTTESALVAESGQVAASVEVAVSCSSRLLTHQTLLWHHHLGHPSLPRLRGMHSRLLVSGLPRSLPPLLRSLASPCLPCVEGRQRAAPHSSSFPLTTAPLQTLHMDVWGPARVPGQGGERYFLLVVDDYTRYTTVFPLQSKAEVRSVLIRWIRAVRRHLSARLLKDFCGAEGIRQTFTLPASPQKNGIAERRIGLVMEVARTSIVHAAAPHFLLPFAVRYAVEQLNLWPHVSHPETSPTLRWTGEVGDASAFRVWGALSFVCDPPTGKLSPRTLRCIFLGFPTDAPGWQFYHPGSRRVLSSNDVTFDESVCFYHLHPCRSSPGPAPSSVSQVDPFPLVEPVKVSSDTSGPAEGGDPTPAATAATSRVGCLLGQSRWWSWSLLPAATEFQVAGTTPPLLFPLNIQSQPQLLPRSPLPPPAPHTTVTESFTERREPASCPVTPVCSRRAVRPRPPPIPGTHIMALRPSSVQQRVVLRSPPASSLPHVPDPESDLVRTTSPTVARLLTTVVTDPSFESAVASALVAELVDFAALCRLDYARVLFFTLPVLRPSGVSLPLAVTFLRTIAMDAEMASWKFTGTYVDEVPPPGANIVDGMWIFKVKRPPGSPLAFKARYVTRGFSQREGVDFFHTFSPTPKMTTLRVLLNVAAQRDYELHSLDFSTAFLQGSLHEAIWLRRPRGLTGSTTLADLGFAPSTTDPSLFLRTDTSLPPFYVLVYVLQRFEFSTSGMGLVLGGQGSVFLTTHSDASWADDQMTHRSTQGYSFSLGAGSVSCRSTRSSSVLSSSCEAEIYAGAMAAQEFRWLTYLLTDLGERPRSPPVLYVDNKAMIALCQDQRLEHRMKHIALRYFLTRELQQHGQLRLAYVATQANTADVFTKALGSSDLQRFCTALGLVPTLPHLLVS
ncbi:unnamed protein product [Closterium sp. NIES-53]